jgi:hypothetical protein
VFRAENRFTKLQRLFKKRFCLPVASLFRIQECQAVHGGQGIRVFRAENRFTKLQRLFIRDLSDLKSERREKGLFS